MTTNWIPITPNHYKNKNSKWHVSYGRTITNNWQTLITEDNGRILHRKNLRFESKAKEYMFKLMKNFN